MAAELASAASAYQELAVSRSGTDDAIVTLCFNRPKEVRRKSHTGSVGSVRNVMAPVLLRHWRGLAPCARLRVLGSVLACCMCFPTVSSGSV